MADLRDINFKNRNRKNSLQKAQKSVWTRVYLSVLIVISIVLLAVYGYVLSANGLDMGSEDTNKVALAFVKLGEGVYPWNLEEMKPDYIPEAVEVPKETDSEAADIKDEKKPFDEMVELFTDDAAMDDISISDEADENDGDAGGDNESPDSQDSLMDDKEIEEGGETKKDAVEEDKADEPDADEGEASDLSASENEADNDDFGSELTKFTTVEDSYFDDALFIGDSRMVGVCEYSGITNATYYAKVSMTIFKLMDTAPSTDETVASVRDGLTANTFGKIYIMVGINELGTGDTEYFINHYRDVLHEIKELQPDAKIFVQALLHVTKDRDKKDKYINNDNINIRNDALKQLAAEEGCYYIDVNPVYDDKKGRLNNELSFDDVHLMGKYYDPWHQFLLEHGIED